MVLVSAIAAIGKHRELGKGNQLLWRIPDDLRRFRALTTGHVVIMGRKTFDSIIAALGKPLPERTTIVVTSTPEKYQGDTVIGVGSVGEAIEKAKEFEKTEVFVCGGAQIYEQALPHIQKLYLTLIDDSKEADSFFPPYEHVFTNTLKDEMREFEEITYRWVDLER